MAGGIIVSPEITLHSRHTSHIRYQLKHILVINIAGYGVVSSAFPGLASGGDAEDHRRKPQRTGSQSHGGTDVRCYARPVSPRRARISSDQDPPSNAWAGNNPGLLTNVLVGSPELAPPVVER